jgi:hypothetical protein
MLFAFVLALVQNVPAETVAPVVAGIGITATALIALMRKHRIKNKELAEQIGLPGKEVTQARKYGITDPEKAQQWQHAITLKPAPEPRARKRRRKQRFQAEQAQEPVAPLAVMGHQPPQKLLLPANLASLVKLAARNQHCRFGATTGVRLSATPTGYRAEATDGRILGIVTGNLPADPQDYPEVPALTSAPTGETQGTIPAEVWSRAFKSIPKKTARPILGNLVAVLGKDQATLVSTDLENVNVLTPRLVEGRFPDTDKIVPKDKPRLTVNVDAKLLIELLQVASAFSSEDHNHKVTMEFYDSARPFVVRTRSDEGQEFTGMAVPLVPEQASQKAA